MTLALAAAIGVLKGLPVPAVHDEFAYLLGADTFARGRWTTHPHACWQHFETFHVLNQPTYQMKYPPGQALSLAVGHWLGHPIIMVWVVLALAVGAIHWSLQTWLPRRWALWGTLCFACNSSLPILWGQSYWGGSLSLLGGALVLGGLGLLKRHATWKAGLALGSGAAILANTRPYEGLVACLVPLAVMAVWLARGVISRRDFALCVVPPAAAVLLFALAGTLSYNRAVTGDAWRWPYMVYEAQYDQGIGDALMGSIGSNPSKLLPNLPLPEPSPRIRSELEQREARRVNVPFKVLTQWYLWIGLFLAPLLLAVRASRRDRKVAIAGSVVLLVLAAVVFQRTSGYAHYLAPAGAALCLVLAQLARRVIHWRYQEAELGAIYVRAVPVMLLIGFCVGAGIWLRQDPGWGRTRQEIVARLTERPGEHLVIVRYTPDHHPRDEWVYNSADIDAARIVWARELSPEQDRQLLDYFPDRTVWLLEAGDGRPSLTPYPGRPHRAFTASAASGQNSMEALE